VFAAPHFAFGIFTRLQAKAKEKNNEELDN